MTVLSARGIYKWFGRRVLTAVPTGWAMITRRRSRWSWVRPLSCLVDEGASGPVSVDVAPSA